MGIVGKTDSAIANGVQVNSRRAVRVRGSESCFLSGKPLKSGKPQIKNQRSGSRSLMRRVLPC